MRRQLLVSTATAALLSGLVFATAQEMPRGGGKQEGATQSQGSPSSTQRGGEGQPRQGMPQREAPSAQGQRSQGERSQAEPGGKGKQSQPKPDRSQQQTTGQGQREQRDQGKTKQQAQPKPDRDRQQQTTGQGQRDQGKAKQQAQPKTEQDQTVGQGRQQQSRQDGGDRTSAQGSAQLSVEQRTRIRESVFARSNVPRVDNLNIRVSVGTTVPSHVRFAPLPREIVEIRPQFRNHQFFVVRDEIIIVDNRRRIVEVIPVESAGGRGPAVRGSSTQVVVDLSPDEIREVQRVLISRGFSVEIDGRLGPRTRQALIQFQRREGLQPTGRIDSRTITSLGVSVKSNQGGGGQQQPSTSGQGGTNQGSGAAQQPAPSNQGARGQSGAGQQGKQPGAGQQGGQNQSPSPTTGQGSGMNQNPPSNQGSGAGQQGGASNPAAKRAPSGGGATSGAGSSPPSGQQQQPK